MPPKSRRPCPCVSADIEREIEARGAERHGLPRTAPERPPQATQVARQGRRHLALLGHLPWLVEAEPVNRGWRKVHIKTDLALGRRDPATRETASPRHHRIAAPIERG